LNIDTIPLNWVALKIEIPDKIKGEKIDFAPKGESDAKKVGDTWAFKNKSLFLKVPSIIIPSEHNILFNPLHPKIAQVKILEITPFALDRRLIKK
jgi:RES domain-containing protein